MDEARMETGQTPPQRRGAPGRVLREPMVHFLVAGALLYAGFMAFGAAEPEAEEDAILVDRRALMSFLQYRANAFEPAAFSAILDSMTKAERAALVDEYVREEVLYREAQALGLEASDYIIRQRMVQKMEFLLGDMAAAGETFGEEELEAYFAVNRQAYAEPGTITFTHVFFDAGARGPDGAAAAAAAAREAMNAAGTGFNDASGEGDRFPFLRNYVDRDFDYVASHFGEGFAASLAGLEPEAERWQGPVESVYGQHLILATRRTERRLPALEEVRAQVESDFLRERADRAAEDAARSLRERYDVEVTAFDEAGGADAAEEDS